MSWMQFSVYDRIVNCAWIAIIQLLAKNGVWQCPTLFWERGPWLVDAIDYAKDPDIGFAARTWVTTHWPEAQMSILKSLDTDTLAVREKLSSTSWI